MDKATKDRLVTEHDDLLGRRLKLEAFIETSKFEELDDANKRLLREQSIRMMDYQKVLAQRICIN